jgi:TfoX/Sxy family transcriptional regulator of competence genes
MAKSVTKTGVVPDPMVARLRATLGNRAFTEQKMFGGTCFMLNGNMLVGTSKRGLLVRVGKDAHAAAVARPHASPMEMGGRSMEGYIRVAPEGTATDTDLSGWIERALAFVETLPSKAKAKSPKGSK